MAGGSLLVGYLQYPDGRPAPWTPPREYVSPKECGLIQHTYDFINKYLSTVFPYLTPAEDVTGNNGNCWCLAKKGETYLFYLLHGGRLDILLKYEGSLFSYYWFDPRNGAFIKAEPLKENAGSTSFAAPDENDWVLWVYRNKTSGF